MGRYSAGKVSFAFFALFALIVLCIAFAASPALAEDEGTLSALGLAAASASVASGSAADNFIFTGTMTYSIPIEIPPGRSGIEPRIALTYNSQRRNGWIGMGWDIDLGSIRRDTSHGVDYLSEEFVYSKDGASHVLTKISDGACTDEYRSKIESGGFLRFFYDGCSSAWTVHDKNGKVYFFGSTSNSRLYDLMDTTRVFQWALERVEDSNGNYLTITYRTDRLVYKLLGIPLWPTRNQIYPEKIEYTGNGTLAPTNYVRFWPEVRSDTPQMYTPNFLVRTFFRLKTIEVGVIEAGGNERAVKAYSLGYQDSNSTGRSLLTSVQVFGSDVNVDQTYGTITNEATASKLPKNIFGYTDHVTGFSDTVINGPNLPVDNSIEGAKISTSRVRFGDFNGDGITDIYRVNGWGSSSIDSIWLFHSDGTYSEIAGPATWVGGSVQSAKQDLARIRLGDFDGDGKTDIYRVNGYDSAPPDSIWLSHGDGTYSVIDGPSTYVAPVVYSNDVTSFSLALIRHGDFDGDGKMDIYVIGEASSSVFLSNGDGTYREISGPGTYINNDLDYAWVDISRIKFGDFNGDGKTDVYRVNGWGGAPPDSVWLFHSDGSFTSIEGPATSVQSGLPWAKIDTARIKFGDFNGDGKTDVYRVNGWGTGTAPPDSIWLSTSAGFWGEIEGPPTGVSNDTRASFTDIARVRFGDFNGDGKTDVYRVNGWGGASPDSVWLSTGIEFQPKIAGPATSVNNNFEGASVDVSRVKLGDLNGDGMTDAARINGWGTNPPMSIYTIEGPFPDLADNFEKEFGGRVTASYTPSTVYQNSRLPFPVQTVSSITTDSGIVSSTATYTYASGYYAGRDREFRGFGYVKRTNPDGTTNETWFHQCDEGEGCASPSDEDLKGRAYMTDFRKPAPTESLMARTSTVWDRGNTPKGTYPVFVKLSQKTTTNYIGVLPVTTHEAYTYYDWNGFINTFTTSGPNAETVTIKNDYINKGFWLWRTALTNTAGSVSGKVRETRFTYDSAGNLTSKKLWNNEAQSESDHPLVQYSYNTAGLVDAVTDPRGNVTTTTYDAAMMYPLTVAYPMTNDVRHEVRTVYDNRFGQVKYAWDENGNRTANIFDPFGRIVGTFSYVGNGPEIAAQEETVYCDDVFPKCVISLVFDGTGYIEKHGYFDGFGRNIETITQGESATVAVKTHYDEMGRAYLTEGPFFGNGFSPGQTPPAEYPWTLTTFNYLGMPDTIKWAGGEHGSVVAMLSYSGLSTLATDPDGQKREEKKDYLGRVVEVKEYADNGEVYRTAYEYNAAGDLEHVRNYDHLNNEMHATHSTFNSLGQKRTMDDPVMGHWGYTYDLSGNLTGQTDAKGQVTTIAYDELGRVLTKSYSTGEPAVNYAYDDHSVQNGVGRLAGVDNTKVATSINEYDVLGRATSVTRTVEGAIPYTTRNSYDPSGRLASLTYPDGYRVDYAYHPGTGLIHTVTGSDGVEYARYTLYEPSGKIGQINYPNTVATRYTYDPWSTRLMGIIANSPAYGDVINRGFSYTPAGDMHVITDYRKGHDFGLPGDIFEYTYTYDNLHRLTGETTTNNIYEPMAYTYDSIGNIQSRQAGGTLMDYTYNPTQKHMLDSVTVGADTYDFTYDANGNMLTGYDLTDLASVASRQIAYNAENKPVQITYTADRKSKTVDFVYDGEGGRAKKILQGKGNKGSTTYYISRDYEITDGQPTKYIYANGAKIASVSGVVVYYFHQDRLGSTAAMTTDDGQLAESSNYFPYGGMREHWGTEVTNYKYTGQELDPETGLYYYGARYYDTALGRFVSPDSIVPDPLNPQSINRYAYVLNNPMRYTDPTGHNFFDKIGDFFEDIGEDAEEGYKDFIHSDFDVGISLGVQMFIDPMTGSAMLSTSETGQQVLAGEIIIGTAVLVPGSPVAMGALTGELLGGYSAYQAGGNILGGVVVGGIVGGVTSYLGQVAGAWVGEYIPSKIAAGAVESAIIGAGSGATVGYAGGAGSWDAVLSSMGRGALYAAIVGGTLRYVQYEAAPLNEVLARARAGDYASKTKLAFALIKPSVNQYTYTFAVSAAAGSNEIYPWLTNLANDLLAKGFDVVDCEW